jgi:hypothetical protein
MAALRSLLYWLYMPYDHPARLAMRRAGLESYPSAPEPRR